MWFQSSPRLQAQQAVHFPEMRIELAHGTAPVYVKLASVCIYILSLSLYNYRSWTGFGKNHQILQKSVAIIVSIWQLIWTVTIRFSLLSLFLFFLLINRIITRVSSWSNSDMNNLRFNRICSAETLIQEFSLSWHRWGFDILFHFNTRSLFDTDSCSWILIRKRMLRNLAIPVI